MITPDTKDWTWVLDRSCPSCDFDASTCEPEAVAGLIRSNANEWGKLGTDGHWVRDNVVDLVGCLLQD